MGFNDGHTSHEGAAIIAHCRGWEVLTLMKPEAIAAVQSLQNNFKQFSQWSHCSVLCICKPASIWIDIRHLKTWQKLTVVIRKRRMTFHYWMNHSHLKQGNPTLHLHKNLKFLVIYNFCDPGVTLVQKLHKEALKPNCPGTQLTGMTMSEGGKGLLFSAQTDVMASVNIFLLIYCLILLHWHFLDAIGLSLEIKSICYVV